MKQLLCAFAVCLAVAAIAGAADPQVIEARIVPANKDDKIDKDKLVGKWHATKLAKELGLSNIEGKGEWEFKNDGTMGISMKLAAKNLKAQGPDGNEIEIQLPNDLVLSIASGKYEVEGNKLTITVTPNGKQEVTYKATITKLTDKEFQTKDEKGNICEFKKEEEK